MNTWELLGIAFGLAMDAFAVSLASGASNRLTSKRAVFRLSFHLGLFQFIMPVVGWFSGIHIVPYIQPFDHWIAAALLIVVGMRMIRPSRGGITETFQMDPSKGIILVFLSVATSIDALAIGLSLAMLDIEILYPAVIIGVITGILSAGGIKMGKKLGDIFGRKIELAGGILLILIGFQIVSRDFF
jgi:putative Mn2+ efflux pump MntP